MNAFTDRRTMLCGMFAGALTTRAAATVGTVPAIATPREVDPVFDLLQRFFIPNEGPRLRIVYELL
jgi:hypothetical protein